MLFLLTEGDVLMPRKKFYKEGLGMNLSDSLLRNSLTGGIHG
jgi:hypothetical protein